MKLFRLFSRVIQKNLIKIVKGESVVYIDVHDVIILTLFITFLVLIFIAIFDNWAISGVLYFLAGAIFQALLEILRRGGND